MRRVDEMWTQWSEPQWLRKLARFLTTFFSTPSTLIELKLTTFDLNEDLDTSTITGPMLHLNLQNLNTITPISRLHQN